MTVSFAPRLSVPDAEEGHALAPRFPADGVGYRSCFYREVPIGPAAREPLRFTEHQRRFDPVAVYGDAPNPTIL